MQYRYGGDKGIPISKRWEIGSVRHQVLILGLGAYWIWAISNLQDSGVWNWEVGTASSPAPGPGQALHLKYTSSILAEGATVYSWSVKK